MKCNILIMEMDIKMNNEALLENKYYREAET